MDLRGNSVTWLGHGTWLWETSEGKRIMVDPWLDGNPACPENLKDPGHLDGVLMSHGHFDHAGEAVETIKRTGAEIVLLDIMMPRRNGWEVLDDLRADDATREVPVVLTSAVYDRIGRRPLPMGGPIRFAAKPFDMNDLLGTIESLLDRHGRGAGGVLSD